MDKVYTPEVVADTPFPQETVQSPTVSSQPSSTGVSVPPTVPQTVFPVRKVAVDLIGRVINTQSRKILESFDLEQRGGFKVGNFEEGVSGEVAYTPNGFTGRNKDGIYTFTIGVDGNATFTGTIQAGTLIAGQLVIGDNRFIVDVDQNGNATMVVNDGQYDRVLIGFGDF